MKRNNRFDNRPMAGIFVIFFLIFCAIPLTAQDVNDDIYGFIDRWQVRGYLDPIFLVRPYSPEVILDILEQVYGQGSAEDKNIASGFLNAIKNGSFEVTVNHRSDFRDSSASTHLYHGETGADLQFLYKPFPGLWAQALFDLSLIDGRSPVKPLTERPLVDFAYDGSMFFLPKGISGDPMGLLYGLSAMTWYGSPSLWGSASIAKTSIGPFFGNGTILGPQAHSAPTFTLNARTSGFRLSILLSQLASNESSAGVQTEKYLALHSYSFSPFPSLDLGLFESVVWAGGIKAQYLVPLSMLFYMQSYAAFSDNSLAGAYLTWRAFPGFQAKATAYFDDVGVKELSRFDFDTKIIGAIQAGLSWAPRSAGNWLVSADYTAVFPYMYAHYFATGREDNYTSYGDALGAALQPNSERYEVQASMFPSLNIRLEGVSRLIRHGNASESLVGGGDGTWFDNGWVNGHPSYQLPFESGTIPRYFRFLSQDVIETTLQAGLSVDWKIPFEGKRMRLRLRGRYMLEYTWNKNLVEDSDLADHYLGFEILWSL